MTPISEMPLQQKVFLEVYAQVCPLPHPRTNIASKSPLRDNTENAPEQFGSNFHFF
jgi:hypothetical protein